MPSIIEVKNISKKYNIAHLNGKYVALRDVLTNILRHPLAFASKKAKAALGQGVKEEFWALKDINFEVKQGEVLGIVGRNGAGKSTLLKILSQITPPTTGEIKIRGHIGSMLEVGTGFHPELTGRENIFLNGAILGMQKKEIVAKFDEIVDFAGIEKFLDTPVKHYSSGMYVRLAFSVAAHLEPEILIVDEVLAVGDLEFQKKCLGKMEDITKKHGRTILFVSHNMKAIRDLCSRCLLLKDGKMEKIGPTAEVVDYYLQDGQDAGAVSVYRPDTSQDAQILKVTILNCQLESSAQLPIAEDFYIEAEYEVYRPVANALFSVFFFADGDLLLLSSESDKTGKLQDFVPGKYITRVRVPAFLFSSGHYFFNAALHWPTREYMDNREHIHFEIVDANNPKAAIFKGIKVGALSLILDHDTKKIN